MIKPHYEVVAAIIKKEGKVFCCKRGNYGECANKWEFPGGKIEPGEIHEQALIREIKEELNCIIKVNNFITTINYEYNTFTITLHFYLCELVEGMPILIEHTNSMWCDKDELKELDFAEADVKIIKIISGELNNEKTSEWSITYIHAHINNISFPKSIEELETFISENGCYNVEDIINESVYGSVIWTVPRYSCKDDIVLFYHAKTAIQWIRKLETEVKILSNKKHNVSLLKEWLAKARLLYSKYGGKIFAIGKIISAPKYEKIDEIFHWSGRIYAKIANIIILDNPIDISEFKDFLLISRQSAITYLPANEYNQLKEIMINKNNYLPIWFHNSKIYDKKISDINSDNFLSINMDYRRKYLFEIEFRSYYVDYLLKEAVNKKVWRECPCHNNGNIYYADNCIFLNEIYILVEVKLNINIEKNLKQQLEHYLKSKYILINKNKILNFEKNYMLVIDTNNLYKYDSITKKIDVILNLDLIKDKEDIKSVFQNIV